VLDQPIEATGSMSRTGERSHSALTVSADPQRGREVGGVCPAPREHIGMVDVGVGLGLRGESPRRSVRPRIQTNPSDHDHWRKCRAADTEHVPGFTPMSGSGGRDTKRRSRFPSHPDSIAAWHLDRCSAAVANASGSADAARTNRHAVSSSGQSLDIEAALLCDILMRRNNSACR